MTFQDLILKLHEFWGAFGCILAQSAGLEVSTDTFHPATFFGVLGKRPWRAAYVQPSRSPTDSHYGDNPFRLYLYHQYQVILKPAPTDFQDIYLESLAGLNIDLKEHDLRFTSNNWNLPMLGARGLGWRVLLNGIEITQLTYLQQMANLALDPIAGTITYNLEWMALFIQGVENFFELAWNESCKYSQLRGEEEQQFSVYNCLADLESIIKILELSEVEAQRCLANNLFFPAYDYTLKCAHLLNILTARRAISPAEQERFIKRIQNLARECAKQYLNIS